MTTTRPAEDRLWLALVSACGTCLERPLTDETVVVDATALREVLTLVTVLREAYDERGDVIDRMMQGRWGDA